MIGRSRRGARLIRAVAAAAVALAVAGTAACTSSAGGAAPSASASPDAAAVPGGDVRVALPPGVTPDYIWPYLPASHASEYNTQQFQVLMYRPLYVFDANGSATSVNYLLSTAYAPAYSDGGKTVTITLKGWKWSNGEAVDASDVIFWLNLMEAEPSQYYGYVKGQLPDNLASYRADGPATVVLHLKSAVSTIWFTYNQLAEITPMPAAWDVTAAGAAPGSGGCVTDSAADHWARCAAVHSFLAGQAADTGSYASNPLWQVVDGPWRLASFNSAATSGPAASFVPNPAYSGSPKPQLARFTYYAYPSDAAEYQALKAGRLDVGYVPDADLAAIGPGSELPSASPLGPAYTLGADYPYGIQYLQVNFANPALGPAFRQLYVRQALQQLINQNGLIESVDRGYGYPTSGGVPARPGSQWVPAVQDNNGGQGPYPYSVANAMALLASRGWKDTGGVMTCASPGSGLAQCGAGVPAGTRLSMTLEYEAGQSSVRAEVTQVAADMAQAGVRVTTVARSAQSLTAAASCATARSGCGWQLLDSAGWDFTGPGYEPTGEPLFATGAPGNPGGYSDSEMNTLIGLTHTSDSLSIFQQYSAFAADELPDLWMPDAYTVTATSAKLANVIGSPIASLLPEYWYFTQ